MTKQEAISLFGTRLTDLGKAINRTKSAISQWPEELDDEKKNLVIGAAVRKGIEVPKPLLK